MLRRPVNGQRESYYDYNQWVLLVHIIFVLFNFDFSLAGPLVEQKPWQYLTLTVLLGVESELSVLVASDRGVDANLSRDLQVVLLTVGHQGAVFTQGRFQLEVSVQLLNIKYGKITIKSLGIVWEKMWEKMWKLHHNFLISLILSFIASAIFSFKTYCLGQISNIQKKIRF